MRRHFCCFCVEHKEAGEPAPFPNPVCDPLQHSPALPGAVLLQGVPPHSWGTEVGREAWQRASGASCDLTWLGTASLAPPTRGHAPCQGPSHQSRLSQAPPLSDWSLKSFRTKYPTPSAPALSSQTSPKQCCLCNPTGGFWFMAPPVPRQ